MLGVKINRFNSSFELEKYMYPMNFQEFLMAIGKEMLLGKIKEGYLNMEAMPSFAHEQALIFYKQ